MSGLIGVAASRNARYSTFTECLGNLAKPPGTVVRIETGIDIATNRRNIVRSTLNHGGFEWVFFVDDDMVFRPDHLMGLLEHDVPIVASLYLNRTPPFYAMAFGEKTTDALLNPVWVPVSLDGAPEEGLAEVVAAGTAGMLVRREVFEAIEEGTWFIQDGTSDDIAFCERVIDAGFKIWLDLGARMGHISIHEVWPRFNAGEWFVGLRVSDTEELNVKLAP